MAKKYVDNIVIENAKIMFRNFRGEERQYNPAGRRNFTVVIPKDLAPALAADGWNIKELPPREDGDEPTPIMQVRVAYGTINPKIWLISGNNKTLLDADTVGNLDYAEIANIDLVIRPYMWEMRGSTGITAYVKDMYVTTVVDAFAAKYEAMLGSDNTPDEPMPW